MRKKLIEVALPLEAINKASSREKSIRYGHPSTLHLWWARRPLAAARAVIFASLVDDPSSNPDLFPTEIDQIRERQRLFDIIEKLVLWENLNDIDLLSETQAEIKKSCGDRIPEFLDPFAGGGSIPLEAQRLGLKVHASDLNPVAVLINKAMLEIPPKFAGQPPINPESVMANLKDVEWNRASGLAEDVAYYANLLKNEAFSQIGHLYPTITQPEQKGSSLDSTVVAWIWARTVKCPNPACGCQMPLIRSFTLAKNNNEDIYIEPSLINGEILYKIKKGKSKNNGSVNRQGARCVICQSPVSFPYIREEGKNKRMGKSLMAIVAKSVNGKVYLPPFYSHSKTADLDRIRLEFDQNVPTSAKVFRTLAYGLTKYFDLFTSRQLILLSTLIDLVPKIQSIIKTDAIKAGLANDGMDLENGGIGAKAYGQAVTVYLGILIDKIADYHSSLSTWHITRETITHTFSRQTLPMVWDFAEGNPFSDTTGSLKNMTEWIVKAITTLPANNLASVKLGEAQVDNLSRNILISTDPPYYDNIIYSDLSDYFYIWLKQSLKGVYKSLFKTILVPKIDELVATPYRFDGDKDKAKVFFESGLKKVFSNFYLYSSEEFPTTIYYAFKQSDTNNDNEDKKIASSGWETMLSALIESGFSITGTWPIKTEMSNRPVGLRTNALASSIVLVCRQRSKDSTLCSRRDFLNALKSELKTALQELQRANIAPVDLAQAAIGPGMAVYSRYSSVLEPDGSAMSVREALGLINEELDKFLTEREGELDGDSRLCVALFSQFGFEAIGYGEADVLARAKNTSIDRLVTKRVVYAQKGKVRLLGLDEIPTEIILHEDNIWLLAHQLTQALKKKGMEACAKIVIVVDDNSNAELARSLAYRLYSVCDRNNWAKEAFDYNSLVQAWPEIQAKTLELKQNKLKQKEGRLF
ncbi:MAG: DUF1156 domain-containing protein [Deltaproteobacteria bacterium]|jgi:putative DNA methylase|nr:DUF1156 domain-containing protein [Deltaproteobacteria bacterium]